MTKISEMLGIDERIKRMVEDALDSKSFTRADVKEIVKVAVDSYAADLYTTMKELEEYKYRFTELEMKLNNLNTFVRSRSK